MGSPCVGFAAIGCLTDWLDWEEVEVRDLRGLLVSNTVKNVRLWLYTAIIFLVKGWSLNCNFDIVQDLSLARKPGQGWWQDIFGMSLSSSYVK